VQISENTIVTGVITGMAFGGAGILRHEGFVLFIPYTAVGETVRCQVTKVSKNFAHAELLEVIQPVKERVTPLCPYYGTCGGCQLQHLHYAAQLTHKHEVVQEALKKIGGFVGVPVQPVHPSTSQWAYRRHVRLSMLQEGEHFAVGYIANDHQTLLKVLECPIFTANNEVFQEIQQIAASLRSPISQKGNVTLFKNEEGRGFLCVMRFEKQLPVNFETVMTESLKNSLWTGFQGIAPGKVKSCGVNKTTLSVAGLTVRCSPNTFVQNHPDQSASIYQEVARQSSQVSTILDLYCGIGILSLILGKQGAQVLGIEENPESIEFAIRNAKTNLLPNVQFKQGDVAKELPKLPFFKQADIVILNPPRIGLDSKVIQAFARVQPKKLIYISCMPSTLARDLKKLGAFGYRITSCKPYDMFPQTAHVETLVTLEM